MISLALEAQREVDGDEYHSGRDAQHGPLDVWERPLFWTVGMTGESRVGVGADGSAGG